MPSAYDIINELPTIEKVKEGNLKFEGQNTRIIVTDIDTVAVQKLRRGGWAGIGEFTVEAVNKDPYVKHVLVNAGAIKLTKAEKRAIALAKWNSIDQEAEQVCKERKVAKDEVLALCEDGKTYKDTDGDQYVIDKFTTAVDRAAVIDWLLSDSNDLLTDKGKKAVKAKLESTRSPKANSAPIKRVG